MNLIISPKIFSDNRFKFYDELIERQFFPKKRDFLGVLGVTKILVTMTKIRLIKMDYIELRACDWLHYLKNVGHSEHTHTNTIITCTKTSYKNSKFTEKFELINL